MKNLQATAACGILILLATTAFAARGPGSGPGGNDPPAQPKRNIGPGGDWQPNRFETARFSGSGNCASCHEGLLDADLNDVSLVSSWRTSMMAFAFVDPLWRAKVSSEIMRLPLFSSAIEEKCVRCHAPMASVEALAAGDPVLIFGDGFTNPEHTLHSASLEGVSCTLCHQIEDSPLLGTHAGASGNFTIGEFDNQRDRRLYGPYEDVFPTSMQGSVHYTPILGEHIRQSAVCATCHDLKTDYVDAQGKVVSTPETRFPEQTPYREWLESDYGPDGDQTTGCLHCHMVHATGVQTAWSPQWIPTREHFSRHTFFSENTMMLGIMDRHSEELGITVDGIDEAIENGRNYLLDAARIEVLESSLERGVLEFRIRVTNLTGHKLPTSIPIRRAYLHVKVTDRSGNVVFESGRLKRDHSIAGVDSDIDPTTFEPHHDVITDPDQVQVYQGVMGNWEGDLTYTFLRASHYKKDNRILPSGFDPLTAADDVQPAGDCIYDENFVGGSDEITYRLSDLRLPGYKIQIELRDQSLAYPFSQDLLLDNSNEVVADFERMYATARPVAELIASTELVVRR